MEETMNRYFIDTHCHLFNFDHIPLYAYIEKVKLNFGERILASLGLTIANTVTSAILKKYEKFLTFFESDVSDNTKLIFNEISEINDPNLPLFRHIDDATKILIPLIMDFEKRVEHKRVESQIRSIDYICKKLQTLKNNGKYNSFKVLPFLGVDPRRFEDATNPQNEVINYLTNEIKSIKTAPVRKDLKSLNDGDIIGIKLYPPLGFDVCPIDKGNEESWELAKYMKGFYSALIELDLPITVHCQEKSYNIVDEEVSNSYTDPMKWLQILDIDDLSKLRINFAHFGGTKQIRKTINWTFYHNYQKCNGIYDDTWTSMIIALLKKYPNTYSDIAVLDFDDGKVVNNLCWLICLDRMGKFDSFGTFSLLDKLLWGSDYPMMLDKYETYKKLIEDFNAFVNISKFRYPGYEAPSQNYRKYIPDPEIIVKKLTEENPMKFLGLE